MTNKERLEDIREHDFGGSYTANSVAFLLEWIKMLEKRLAEYEHLSVSKGLIVIDSNPSRMP